MKLDITETIEFPEGITGTLDGKQATIKGPKGEVSKLFNAPIVSVALEGNKITFSALKGTKRHKRMINTYRAHINNMITGVQTPYLYKLKVCSGHFPMNVALNGDQVVVKNFLGEKKPRTLTIKKGAIVKINGEDITVESCDKELAGNVASDIELLTVKRNRDLRVFQDGIYITEKAGTIA